MPQGGTSTRLGVEEKEHVHLYTANSMSVVSEYLSTTSDGAGEVNRTGRFGWLAQSRFSISAIESNKSILASFSLPARHAFAFGNSAEQASRPIGKPLDLFRHPAL
jgi:hypothetical protein